MTKAMAASCFMSSTLIRFARMYLLSRVLGFILIFCLTFSLFNWSGKSSELSFLKKIELAKKMANSTDADADYDCEDDDERFFESELIERLSQNRSIVGTALISESHTSCGYWNITTPPPKA